jgi:MHS family proline/betaine transporter-like MFS transporter
MDKALNSKQRSVILAVTIAGILEWYEVFLYVYWAPIISKLFFGPTSGMTALIDTLFIFGLGFLVRPIGGLFFGHLGDMYGRKISLIASVLMISFPTLVIGFLPTYDQIGYLAPIILVISRFLQGFPAGGELPGAICYLAESSPPERRTYMCSWAFVGPQLGAVFSILECFLLETYLSPEHLMAWGWRLSFIVGGLIGLFGFYLRRSLSESPLFENLAKHSKLSHRPVFESLARHKKNLMLGFSYSALNAVGFYMICIFSAVYFGKILGTSSSQNSLITAGLITLGTLPIPLYGMLGNKYTIKPLLITSAVGIALLCFPLYFSLTSQSVFYTVILEMVILLLLNVQFAFLPSLLAELFPTSVRFTCVGISFNTCDSIMGGLTPVLSLVLIKYTHHTASFTAILLFAALLSLTGFLFLKNRIKHES